jgi:hypothetical protein
MLRITVEIIPGGFAPFRKTIAIMSIANVSELADISNYRVEATENRNDIAGLPARSLLAEVRNHDRRQSVWSLIAVAASAVISAAPT